MDDWQSKFSSGFASSQPVPIDWGPLLIVVGIIALLGLLAFVYRQIQQYLEQNEPPASVKTDQVLSRAKVTKTNSAPGKLNPLQQKLIQELIDEFRKKETLAQAVPSNVLEKYSEFFFQNLHLLKTDEKEVEKFLDVHYPLQVGQAVEIDLQTSGTLHLVKTKVLGVDAKHVTVEFDNQVPELIRKGMNVFLNYSQGKHFLNGATSVVDFHPSQGIVLKRPTQVKLTSERRYPRLDIKGASGSLHDTKSTFQTAVKVLDLSPEGVRVQVGRPLDKTHTYQLVFQAHDGVKNWSFGPIECVTSKAFLTGTGTYETGLAFLYVSLDVKTQIWTFMKTLTQNQSAAAAKPPKLEPNS